MPIDFEEEVNITDVYDEIWFNIINRTITPKDDTKIQDILVQNDANSRNLCFMIQRYFEDEDLSTKNIRVHFVNSLNQHDYSDTHSLEICGIDDDVLSFKWLIDKKVCVETGNVKFAIEFYDSRGYELFTKPTVIQVEEGIYTVGEMQENVDWYQTFRDELANFKEQIASLSGLYDKDNNLVMTWNQIKDRYSSMFEDGKMSGTPNTVSPLSHIEIEEGRFLIGNDIIEINDSAFQNCSNFSTIKISDNVKIIGERAFRDCDSLTSIVIPSSVQSIGNKAFYHCTSLTSVIIGDGVTSIDEDAFAFCNSLTKIKIPISVTNIGKGAFYDTALTDVYYEGSKEDWNNMVIDNQSNGILSSDNVVIHYSVLIAGDGIEISDGVISVDGDVLEAKADKTYVDGQLINKADKTYVDNLMNGAIKRSIVSALPTTNIDTNTIYMIPSQKQEEQNIYDEYMYINSNWELIGSTAIDLSGYATKTDLNNKADKTVCVSKKSKYNYTSNKYEITIQKDNADNLDKFIIYGSSGQRGYLNGELWIIEEDGKANVDAIGGVSPTGAVTYIFDSDDEFEVEYSIDIKDYISAKADKTYVDKQIGDIETTLDEIIKEQEAIIAIQNSLIGGVSE